MVEPFRPYFSPYPCFPLQSVSVSPQVFADGELGERSGHGGPESGPGHSHRNEADSLLRVKGHGETGNVVAAGTVSHLRI